MKALRIGLLFLVSISVYAAPSIPLDDLSGPVLRAWLKQHWYTDKHHDLGYNSARRFMYNLIDKDSDGNVTGVYTGFQQPGRDTSFLDPINAEHTIPQSWFGKKPPMKSDIHHLFPTHKNVNGARGSFPFDEIEDSSTDKWYVKSSHGLKITLDIPTNNIDAYRELKEDTSFEPREDHKGNTARAIFYFYTMYPDAAGNISRIADKEILFQWHTNDPVDAAEIGRNQRIENRQGNRNPYIDHPDLVARAWGIVGDIPVEDENIIDRDNIEALKAEVALMEASLTRLKAKLAELEQALDGN